MCAGSTGVDVVVGLCVCVCLSVWLARVCVRVSVGMFACMFMLGV